MGPIRTEVELHISEERLASQWESVEQQQQQDGTALSVSMETAEPGAGYVDHAVLIVILYCKVQVPRPAGAPAVLGVHHHGC